MELSVEYSITKIFDSYSPSEMYKCVQLGAAPHRRLVYDIKAPQERFESMRSHHYIYDQWEPSVLCSSRGALITSYNDHSACTVPLQDDVMHLKPARESKTMTEAEDQTSSRILSTFLSILNPKCGNTLDFTHSWENMTKHD